MLSPTRLRPLLLALPLLLSICATAQTYTPKRISFTGAPDFKREDLLSVAALKPATPITQADINAAAERLNATGLFSDIKFSLDATGLTFALTPFAPLLPARFSNFLWWTPEDLDADLRRRVPLYIGQLPTEGPILANIDRALVDLLATKGITAVVSHVPAASSPTAPPDAIKFNIDSPAILVSSLNIVGASAAMQPLLDRVEVEASSKNYDTRYTAESIVNNITTVYRDNGYLDIAVPRVRRGDTQVAPGRIGIDMIATVEEGKPYRLTRLDWAGSPFLSSEDFTKLAKLKPGDIASQSLLRQSLGVLSSRYFMKGFIDAKITASAEIDHAAHTAAYTVHVSPGEQYRVQTVDMLGLTSEQRAEIASAWRLHKGDIFDAEYISTFLKKNTALRSLAGYSATFKTVADTDTHLVVVTITFMKGGVLTE